MKKLAPGLLVGAATLAVTTALVAPPATAVPAAADHGPGKHDDHPARTTQPHRTDNHLGPLQRRQHRLRDKALAMLGNGTATLDRQRGGGATVTMAKGPKSGSSSSYEFPVNKTDQVFTVLSQFADVPHNTIPQPDRSTDNSTYWVEDFNQDHYDEMFNGSATGGGESFHDYYRQLSSGRYDVGVGVQDWVGVPGDAASYGANRVEDDGGSWAFIEDTANAWYADQVDQGKSDEEIESALAQYDQWDRYDYDHDGNYNEPDGYIDHFQAIHSGEGEEAGGGALGEDAIWSHRWYDYNGYGTNGPSVGGTSNLNGGAQIGDTGIWIGDYTVEPENGGLGVFAHEFGHDLGLPDYYDTNGGENSTAFWTLMSSGSWLSHGSEAPAGGEGIGTVPGLMGPQEKYDLGWLDYSQVSPGDAETTVNLGPAQHTYDDPQTGRNEADQAVKVNLADKVTTTTYTAPPEGDHVWWSGRGNELTHTLTSTVPAADKVTVTAQAWYQIEQGYDYLYAEYSTDGGDTWTQIGKAVTGSAKKWSGLRYRYSPNGASEFRFRYTTDEAVEEAGAFLDAITVTAGGTTITDGAESADSAFVPDGWSRSTGTEVTSTPRYYLMENRQYVGYDDTLRTGPYNFDKAYTAYNHVEFFGFQPGMLVWYVDLANGDNNTSSDPGHGQALPVDARPTPFRYPDGTMPSNRRQPFDATFGLRPVDQMCLHKEVLVGNGKHQTVERDSACAPASDAMPTFADTGEDAYWSADNPWGSTKLPGSGVTATVTGEDDHHFLTVAVDDPAQR